MKIKKILFSALAVAFLISGLSASNLAGPASLFPVARIALAGS